MGKFIIIIKYYKSIENQANHILIYVIAQVSSEINPENVNESSKLHSLL